MTKQELNRDYKRLYKRYDQWEQGIGSLSNSSDQKVRDAYREEYTKMSVELNRLYRADKEFDYSNKNSILIAIKLNNSMRVVPLHRFGIFIEV
jgi:hypothetical protein